MVAGSGVLHRGPANRQQRKVIYAEHSAGNQRQANNISKQC